MPNRYARLADVKKQMGGSGMGATRDAEILSLAESVSRWIDSRAGRHFYSRLATVYPERDEFRRPSEWHHELSGRYSYGGGWQPWQLPLDWDVISITSLQAVLNADGTYGFTLVADTDYWLWRDGAVERRLPEIGSYQRIDLNRSGSALQITQWPTQERGVKLVGKLGFSEATESAGALGAAISSTSATSVTMASGHSVQAGDTMIVDSEQMDVTAVATNTLTVTRGINGTTAATHLNAAAVSIRRYPTAIEQVCADRIVELARTGPAGASGGVAIPEVGGFGPKFDPVFANIASTIKQYHRTAGLVVI